jgi:hypothetical protein
MINHRTGRAAAAGVCAITLIGALAAGSPSTASKATGPEEFTLNLRHGTEHLVDAPPTGDRPTPGDVQVFRKRLTHGGDRAGAVWARATVITGGPNPTINIEGHDPPPRRPSQRPRDFPL